jgi:alpha-L-arabinofuranosidase
LLTATATLDPGFRIAPVDRRLFGSFVEHMGRCVYGGIFEPGHPESDVDGYRRDVLELVRELGVSVVRYPGGNFVSGYRWEDGVGPVPARPRRLDLAWRSLEPNTFGLNEFLSWCGLAGVEPMLAVNLGTRGLEAACDLLEYTNHPGGTALSDLRASHGFPNPHAVSLWCLGNELDGPWQIGHKSAEEYGRLAEETAKAMKLVDPSVRLVACGSSGDDMPTFGQWEATVLDHTFDHVDYLSLHAYYEQLDEDAGSFLASAFAMDGFIDGVVATCDHIAARKRSRRKLKLSFDEWNVWYMSRFSGRSTVDWERAPRLIEDEYTVLDAVVVGNLLMSLLRHADRVGIACLAQLVNVIGPIRAEPDTPAWRQTTFHPFALTARYASGDVLRVEPATPSYSTTRYGDVPAVDVVATHNQDTGDTAIFAVNRLTTEPVAMRLDLRALPEQRIADHRYLGGTASHESNTATRPDRVVPLPGSDAHVDNRSLHANLPPASWTMLRLAPTTTMRPSR